jgi:hypothetical protein
MGADEPGETNEDSTVMIHPVGTHTEGAPGVASENLQVARRAS